MYSNESYLIELLTQAGYLNEEILQYARSQKSPTQDLVDFLIQANYLTEDVIAQVAASNSLLPVVDLGSMHIPQEVRELITPELARRFRAIPISDDGFSVNIAIDDPLNLETMDSLPQLMGRDVIFSVATRSAVESRLNEFYRDLSVPEETDGLEGEDAPIIRLVQQMLTDAFKMRASDIHIEPMENRLRIRYRVDGKLVEVATHPKKLLSPIIARLKVMSTTMSIAEKRMPQDGRIQMSIGGKQIDLRVSSVPSNHGESIVMRILDKSALVLGLPQLGFFSDDEAVFDRLITLPDGIILVTGPTGSGKTTTLYACLNHINRPDKKIITVEDPVDYELSGIKQVMVKADIGMTFAAALRAMLRQAPNIIMIGEIRDMETASIAINASLTGHLVLSTLHTNDSAGAITRLVDMGCEPFLVAASLEGVLAQRLVRTICPDCRTPYEPSSTILSQLGVSPYELGDKHFFTGRGCDKCSNSGYRGRKGIYELLDINDTLRDMITDRAPSVVLKQKAIEMGMSTLREDGLRNIYDGNTTIEEVLKYT